MAKGPIVLKIAKENFPIETEGDGWKG